MKKTLAVILTLSLSAFAFAGCTGNCDKGHTEVIDPEVPATCTSTGLTEGKHCKVCNEVIVKQEVIPMTEHSVSEWTTVKESTKTENGLKKGTCTVCKQETEEIIWYQGSENLGYSVNADKKTCTIENIGGCTDSDLYIPAKIGSYTVTAIADFAFFGDGNIKSVTIPGTVKTIGELSFIRVKNLTKVTLYEGIESIGDSAFVDNPIESIVIPSTVKYIGSAAFYLCSKLDVDVPETVEFIGRGAFNGTPLVKDTDNYDESGVLYINGFLYSAKNLKTADFTIKDGTKKLVPASFYYNKSIVTVTIPEGVEDIGTSTFCTCQNLETVNVPSSVKHIGGSAFYGCIKLKNVTLPDGITAIEDSTFNGCIELEKINVPASVKTIGVRAFCYCDKLKTIEYAGTKDEWNAIYKDIDWKLDVTDLVVKCRDGEIKY